VVKNFLSAVFFITIYMGLSVASAESASTEVTLNSPTYSGSGCPADTVGVALTPDQKTLSVVFDAFVAQAGDSVGLKKDVKACKLIVPMNVPQGLQFTIVKLDYRGYNLVPEKAKNKYTATYLLTDEKNRQMSWAVQKQFNFSGPLDDDYTVSNEVQNLVWSPCGKNVKLNIKTRAVAMSNKAGEDAMATVDSLDMSVSNTQLGYHLQWRKCVDGKPVFGRQSK
jgi:hypothetical protein